MRSARATLSLMRTDRVVVAVDDEDGAATRSQAFRNASVTATLETPRGVGQRPWLGLEAPSDAVLDLLRRVRFAEHLTEEELEEVLVVALPVVAVVLGPTLGGFESDPGTGTRCARRLDGRERNCRADRHHAEHTLGARRLRPAWSRARRPTGRPARRVRAGGIEHRDGVGGELVIRVVLGTDRRSSHRNPGHRT